MRVGRGFSAGVLAVLAAVVGRMDSVHAETAATQPSAFLIHISKLGAAEPLAGVSLKVEMMGKGWANKPLMVTTDEQGNASVSSPGVLSWVKVKASKAGMVGVSDYWYSEGRMGKVPSATWSLAMEPGTTISGRVVDDGGAPIAGAHVVADVAKKYPGSTQRVWLEKSKVLADAEGKWTVEGVPAMCDEIRVTAWDYQHLTGDGFYFARAFNPQANLRDGTATLVLLAGTRVEGIVRGPDGKPVEGAKVFYNADRRVSNGIPALMTDKEGKFVLGIKPKTTALLLIEHAGQAPVRVSVPVTMTAEAPLEITLPRPEVMRGRVLDGSGKPLVNATVDVHGWKGRDILDKEIKTDSNGAFEWAEAPNAEVTADVYADGFSASRDVKLQPSMTNTIQMVMPTEVHVRVVDADTGAPVKNYTVDYSAMWKAGERFVEQGSDIDTRVQREEAGFSYKFDEPASQYKLRIHAPEKFAEETEAFAGDGQLKEITVRMQKGESIRGVVVKADGTPVREGNVYPVTEILNITNGVASERDIPHAVVDATGHFSLPPDRAKAHLVIISKDGVGFWGAGTWEKLMQFPVEATASVNARFMHGTKPLAARELGCTGKEEQSPNALPRVIWQYSAMTDSAGSVALKNVWPGSLNFAEWIPNHAMGRSMPLTRGWMNVEAGKTYDVTFGGSGHPIVGKLEMPFAKATPWMVRIAELHPASDPKGRPLSPDIADDGTFRIDDVQAGEYVLTIALHEQPPENTCGWGRVLGEYSVKVMVPEVPGGGLSETPVNVGTLTAAPVPMTKLAVGDVAPDFSVKGLNGKMIHLADYQGKIVLLDFWATWCAPCVAEIPHVRDLQAQVVGDSCFVLIGMNEDDEPRTVDYATGVYKMTWAQGMLGTQSDIAKQYSATAIPATILIGADGRVIARDLRGDALKKAVTEALAKK